MQNPSKGWILLSHGHKGFPQVDEADILDALPPAMRDGPRQSVQVYGKHEIGSDLTRIDWDALQAEQAEMFETQLAPLRNEGRGVAYFGRALLPLAFDLGFRVENWVPHFVFQYHRHSKSWQWPGRSAGGSAPEPIVDDNLPRKPSAGTGPIVIRVSVTTRIDKQDVLAKIPNPVDDIEIHLGTACGVSSLETHDDLERVVKKFEETLYRIRELYPQAGPIHLFAAVPVGLAFRMGTVINPTVHPLVQTYQYVHNAVSKYQRALVVGVRGKPDMKIRIQFLTAEPDSTRRLSVDRELRDIADRLREGEHREKFDIIEPRLAVRTKDLQNYIRRDLAHIIHFSGHGEANGYLLMEDRAGNPDRIPPNSLRRLLDLWNDDDHIRCVVINACHSHDLARELTRDTAVVPCAIGTSQQISDGASLNFSDGFYSALADGVTLEKSFRAGIEQVRLQYKSDADYFKLEVADKAQLQKPIFAGH
ncbi:MAG: SAVED domain-containing protein [Proteobacteria bacterium]|nr:SAVED domain-containing protein [Pseudomonadota bacterium]